MPGEARRTPARRGYHARMANPWSNEHSKDRARERDRIERDEPHGADAGANEQAKERLRAGGEVRETAQAPNDRAYGPKGER